MFSDIAVAANLALVEHPGKCALPALHSDCISPRNSQSWHVRLSSSHVS